MSPQQILRELVEAAVLWRKTKNAYLQTPEVLHRRKAHLQAVVRLDLAVAEFEKLPLILRKLRGKKKPLDWKKLVDGLAGVATALSKATDKQRPILDVPFNTSKVIDVKAD